MLHLRLRGGGEGKEYSSKDAQKYDRESPSIAISVPQTGRTAPSLLSLSSCSAPNVDSALPSLRSPSSPHLPSSPLVQTLPSLHFAPHTADPAPGSQEAIWDILQSHPDEIHFLNTIFNFLQRRTPCFNGPMAPSNYQIVRTPPDLLPSSICP